MKYLQKTIMSQQSQEKQALQDKTIKQKSKTAETLPTIYMLLSNFD